MFSYLINIFSRFLHIMLGIGTPRGFPPPLSSDDERKYFRLAAAGDADAREKLIVHNLRLVSHIVRKYYSSSNMQEDLVSVGSLGLIKAVDSFDTEKGARFATYAAKCIQNEILMFFRQQRKLQSEVSINDAIDVDRDGNPLTYIDVISSDDNMAEVLDLRLNSERVHRYIKTALLRPREADNSAALRAFRQAPHDAARGCCHARNLTLVCQPHRKIRPPKAPRFFRPRLTFLNSGDVGADFELHTRRWRECRLTSAMEI